MCDLLDKYSYAPDAEDIGRRLDLLAANSADLASDAVLKDCFSLMDVTTLHCSDTVDSVTRLVHKVNSLARDYPQYPLPASVCVFPNFASTVAAARESEQLHVTAVAGCFPDSQSFLEVKIRECELAVENGADEIDIVLSLNAFLAQDYETARHEIRQIRAAIDKAAAANSRTVILKVILETGVLVSPEAIARASFLAMEEGADFIKTSTGRVSVNATPMAAYVMCRCIGKFYEKTGRKVGFKAAGGISSASDAVSYYAIVASVLGREWISRDLFRFGVSRLANALMSAVEKRTVTVF